MTPHTTDGFRDAIVASGLTAPDVIEADGKLRRFSSNGKSGDDAGWYVFHIDGIAAGIFGDWRTGLSETWKADAGRKLTKQEAAEQRAKLDALRRERDAAEMLGHEQAAKKASAIWQAEQSATADQGYLARKGIQPHGTKVGSDGRLLVPMRDTAGKLWNIERIAAEKPADGSADKKGLYLGRRTGCYFAIGSPKGAAVLCIAEGFATGASIHEATGLPVAVAFNAGNLEPVAKALRQKFPDLPMVICADDDYRTEGNPGRTKAEAAALAVGGVMVSPVFQGERPEKATDFNDLHQVEGMDAVQRIVGAVVDVLTEQAEKPQPEAEDLPVIEADAGVMSDIASVATSDVETEPASEEPPPDPSPFPGKEDRPCYVVLDGWTEYGGRKHRPGVYFCGMTEAKKDTPAMPFDLWFCSPLYIEAVTFDGQANNFGRLLRFKNSLGRWREWAMPMELLRGAGDELRGELLAMGIELDPYKARQQPCLPATRTPEAADVLRPASRLGRQILCAARPGDRAGCGGCDLPKWRARPRRTHQGRDIARLAGWYRVDGELQPTAADCTVSGFRRADVGAVQRRRRRHSLRRRFFHRQDDGYRGIVFHLGWAELSSELESYRQRHGRCGSVVQRLPAGPG